MSVRPVVWPVWAGHSVSTAFSRPRPALVSTRRPRLAPCSMKGAVTGHAPGPPDSAVRSGSPSDHQRHALVDTGYGFERSTTSAHRASVAECNHARVRVEIGRAHV